MKHLLTICSVLVLSAFAFAGSPDFTDLDHNMDHGGGHSKCMKAGWEAAKPTDAQNAQLKVLIDNLHNLFDANKDALKTAGQNLMASFAPHPIDKTAVHGAQATLQSIIMPLMTAVTDTMVDGINLLTKDQRGEFDTAFKACINKK